MKPEEVKAARKRMGYTQRQLAALCGVSGQTVHNWEHGRHEPKGPVLMLLSEMEERKRQDWSNLSPLPEYLVKEWAQNRLLYGGEHTQRLARTVINILGERDRLQQDLDQFQALRARMDQA